MGSLEETGSQATTSPGGPRLTRLLQPLKILLLTAAQNISFIIYITIPISSCILPSSHNCLNKVRQNINIPLFPKHSVCQLPLRCY